MKKSYTLLLFSLMLATACLTRQEKPSPPEIVALVNGNAIKEDSLRFKIKLELNPFKSDQPDGSLNKKEFNALKKKVLDKMIQNRVIIDWGDRQGITLSETERQKGLESYKQGYSEREFEEMLEEKSVPLVEWRSMMEEKMKVEKIIFASLEPKVKITPQEVEKFYRENSQLFEQEEQVRVRHIVTDTKEKAEKLYQMIIGGENFAKLAIMNSLSPDRADGGDLGFFRRGTHPKEFDNACFNLHLGEISPIVKSPYGYHIFKLIDSKPKGLAPLGEVEDQIISELTKKRMSDLFDEWYNGIKQKSQVQIVEKNIDNMKAW